LSAAQSYANHDAKNQQVPLALPMGFATSFADTIWSNNMATFEKRLLTDGTVSIRAIIRIKGLKTTIACFRRLTDAKRWACEFVVLPCVVQATGTGQATKDTEVRIQIIQVHMASIPV
jgi:hypothetical protein